MKSLGQLLLGLLTAAGSGLLVLAAASLALVEGGSDFAARLTPGSSTPGMLASPVAAQTIVAPRVLTATPSPTAASRCQPPQDWAPYTVQPGDTLASVSAQTGLAAQEILQRNCLLSDTLLPHTILYLPFSHPTATETLPPGLPTAAPTLARFPCRPPAGWVIYVVHAGENLYRLGLAFGVEPYVLRSANCLSGSTIYAGQKLFVPNVPTRTPVSTQTLTARPSATPAPATLTPSPTPGLPATQAPVFTPTQTSTPTTAAPTVAPPTPAPEISPTIESSLTPAQSGTTPAT